MSKTHILIHIVFTTKYRQPTIPEEHKRRLFAYIHGIIKKYNCLTHRINGMADHIHILIDLHPTVSLAKLVKEIKQSSSLWMKREEDFKGFTFWNEGYYAASIGVKEKDACIAYIKNQEEHHRSKDMTEEIREWTMEHGLEWNEQDWNATPSG